MTEEKRQFNERRDNGCQRNVRTYASTLLQFTFCRFSMNAFLIHRRVNKFDIFGSRVANVLMTGDPLGRFSLAIFLLIFVDDKWIFSLIHLVPFAIFCWNSIFIFLSQSIRFILFIFCSKCILHVFHLRICGLSVKSCVLKFTHHKIMFARNTVWHCTHNSRSTLVTASVLLDDSLGVQFDFR